MENQQLYDDKSAQIWWDFSRSFRPNPPPTTPFASIWYINVSIPKWKIDICHYSLQDDVSCATTFEGQCKPHHLAKRYSLQKGQIWIIMTQKDWLCRHDICQNFYATDVLSSKNLRKTTLLTNSQFARKQHKCLNLNTNHTHCIKVTHNFLSQSL